ncbi:MAG TPA: hypothetical protein DIW81_02465 [Planctomycetaceae bacterium]|nr:hypothetical protein [Planctomycetaceae bacterium]
MIIYAHGKVAGTNLDAIFRNFENFLKIREEYYPLRSLIIVKKVNSSNLTTKLNLDCVLNRNF